MFAAEHGYLTHLDCAVITDLNSTRQTISSQDCCKVFGGFQESKGKSYLKSQGLDSMFH